MEKSLKGTKSEENIRKAFAGESQARAKYVYFAEQARSEGREEIANLFEKMAQNELAHAKIWFKLLYGGLGDSASNLLEAANGESYESLSMYPDFAKQAREDGLEELAKIFDMVGAVEKTHERKFLETYAQLAIQDRAAVEQSQTEEVEEQLEEETLPQPKAYRCMFCGYQSDTPMDVCPLCQAIGAFERNHQD